MRAALARRLAAEFLGTLLLVAVVIGSGIQAEALAAGNAAVALLANTIATAAILFVAISALGPISGAHFNPAVSVVLAVRGELAWREVPGYGLAQAAGGIAGAGLANAMFALPLVSWSQHVRSGFPVWLSEAVATFALVLTLLLVARARSAAVPAAVALVIAAGYWATASTSFANPAVTLARTLSDTFAGIDPHGVAAFVAAQALGAAAALATAAFFERARED